MNKKGLYDMEDKWLSSLGITKEDYPLNAIAIAKKYKNLCVVEMPFEDRNIGGALLKDKISTMCLNANKNKLDTNFDCMHEMIHFLFHKKPAFNSSNTPSQIMLDSFLEWQANEGAAQALVPYQLFLPEYIKALQALESGYLIYDDFFSYLSKKFKVSETVLKFRIEGLSYEIYQYTNYVPISKITILSRQERTKRNLIKLDEKYLPYRFKPQTEYNFCE